MHFFLRSIKVKVPIDRSRQTFNLVTLAESKQKSIPRRKLMKILLMSYQLSDVIVNGRIISYVQFNQTSTRVFRRSDTQKRCFLAQANKLPIKEC